MNKWKPEAGERYYVPTLLKPDFVSIIMDDDEYFSLDFANGLVCRTKEEAIELADIMLEAVKNKGGNNE